MNAQMRGEEYKKRRERGKELTGEHMCNASERGEPMRRITEQH
jgi:hypothetical protein